MGRHEYAASATHETMAPRLKYLRHASNALALELAAEVLAAMADRSVTLSSTLRSTAGRCLDYSGRQAEQATHSLRPTRAR